MNRFYFFTAILAIALMGFGVVVHAQTAEPRVFGDEEGIFVVVNQKAHFYEIDWDKDSWVANPGNDFTLPTGYRSVYGYHDVICVVINNKIQRYKFNGASWAVDAQFPEFTLPDGYGSVFGSKRSIGGICVIVNNKIQIYGYNGRIWGTDPITDFTLPNDYKSVFGGSDGIGVAVGNKAQFYEFKSATGWTADSRYDLTLPDGYVSVFGTKNPFNRWESVFVVMNDRVLYYSFDRDNNKWEKDSDWVFMLPKN